MFIGDSLTQYQFDALLAWLRRAGMPMRCTKVAESESGFTNGASSSTALKRRRHAAIREMMTVAKYEGANMDCMRPGLTLMLRRLNLLPLPGTALTRYLDAIFAPLGGLSEGSVAVINVGLHYGPLSRHAAFSDQAGRSSAALAAALAMLHEGVGALARAACFRGNTWPRIIWREHTPQHFANGGEYSASSHALAGSSRLRATGKRRRAATSWRENASKAPLGCMPLSRDEAGAMYDHLARPSVAALASASAAAAAAFGKPLEECARRIELIPAFWPLVARHEDHAEWRGRAAGKRTADCTQ